MQYIYAIVQAAFIIMNSAEIGAIASWSWWWVFSPTIFVVALILLCIIIQIWAHK